MSNLQLPNQQTPVLDGQNHMSYAWWRFFQQLTGVVNQLALQDTPLFGPAAEGSVP